MWQKCESLASNSKPIYQQTTPFRQVSNWLVQTTTSIPVMVKPMTQVYKYSQSVSLFNNQYIQSTRYPTYNANVDTSNGFKYYKNANIMSGNFGKRDVLNSRLKRINSINFYSNDQMAYTSLEEWCRRQYPDKFKTNQVVIQTTFSNVQSKMPIQAQSTSSVIYQPSITTTYNRPATTQATNDITMQSFFPTQTEIQQANNNFMNVFGKPLFPPNAFKQTINNNNNKQTKINFFRPYPVLPVIKYYKTANIGFGNFGRK
jgi:hypothetical protein